MSNLTLEPAEAALGCAALLRERTKQVHREAERAGFVADLLRGRATAGGYALFLRNLRPAYAAMEPALTASRDHPLVAAFSDPRLYRLQPLEADLRAIAGDDWSTLPVVPEAARYAEAILAAARDPECLVGHAYARYLGDLSGGQILKPLLARTLHLGPEALGFYDFPGFADLADPKLAMRAALDAVRSESEAAATISEAAVAAFRHNIAVSEAVQEALVR